MGTVKQTFDGDGSGLQKELERLQREIIKLREESAKTARESVNDSRAQERALKRFADSVKRDVAGPLEDYRARLTKLRDAHKAGLLSQEQYRRGVDRLKTSVRGTNEPLDKAARSQGTIAGAAGKLATVAASYLSISAAVQVVNRDLERQIELQDKASQTQISVGDAQAGLRTNLGSLSPEERRAFIDQVQGIQQATGFQDLVALNQAASAGISGGGTTEQVIDTVTQAARVSRQNPGQLEVLTGAGIDIGKASGLTDAESNLGFILSAGAVSRPTSLDAQARNIPTAVIGVAGTDATGDRQRAAREGAASFAVLSNMAADVRGESSASASISLATQLRDFFGAEGRDDPKTFGGRVRAIQSDASLREAFFEQASFEQKFKIPVEQMLTAGTEAAANFEAAFRAISFDRDKFQTLATDLGSGGITGEIRSSAAQRQVESVQQQAERADTLGARTAMSRDVLTRALEQTNTGIGSSIANFGTRARFETAVQMGYDPEQTAIDLLRELQQSFRSVNQTWGGTGELSEDQRRRSGVLGDYIEQLLSRREQEAAAEREASVTAINEGQAEVAAEVRGLREDLRRRPLPGQQVVPAAIDQHR